jgi:penicillin-insensitive murein endopeptidase
LMAIVSLLAVLASPLMVAIAGCGSSRKGARRRGSSEPSPMAASSTLTSSAVGLGYVTYSFLGSAAGRQYVDGRVRDALLATFSARSRAEGGRRFVMGETGWPSGGRFRPHRSHQNGMAVDVFMPVQTTSGDAAALATWPWNKFGYGMEFDERGEMGDLRIQFESVAAFLLEVDGQARQRGLRVARVIITPEFVPLLLETPTGRRLGALADRITRKPAWVRHDEHFHIDFEDASVPESGGSSP